MNSIQPFLIKHIDVWTQADPDKARQVGRMPVELSSLYGIKKLRLLLLNLAVSGELSNSKNAWKDAKLSDLGRWAVGNGFPEAEQGGVDGEILFAKVSDMNLSGNEKYILSTRHSIDQEAANRLRVNIHPSGTVIFPKIGGAIATNKRRILTRPTVIDNNCLGIIPALGINPEWVFLQLLSIDLSKYQAGTSVPALSQANLEKISIRIPDFDEQNRLIVQVNSLMLLCDSLEGRCIASSDAHQSLVGCFLDLLLKAKTSEEYEQCISRMMEVFEVLFISNESLLSLKSTVIQLGLMGRLGLKSDQSPSTLNEFPAQAGLLNSSGLFPIPSLWEWSKLSKISKVFSGGAFKSFDFNKDRGVKVIKITNVGVGRFIETEDFLPESYLKTHQNFRVSAGDLIIALTRPFISGGLKVCRCPLAYDGALLNQRVAVIRAQKGIYPDYIYMYMQSAVVLGIYQNRFNGTSLQPNLKMSDILDLPIPIPPYEEQVLIVEIVNKLHEICDLGMSKISQANLLSIKIADIISRQRVN